MCINASDVIAIAAIFIAIIVPVIQTFYERRREWHGACEILFRSIDSLYEDIISLVKEPSETNHISYQHILNQRKNLLSHYGKRFIFHKAKMEKASNMVDSLVEIPIHVDYEELINKGYKNKKMQNKNYLRFIQIIRNYTVKASEALVS